ncbi:MAG: thiolase family protein [Clostridiaceae bacterium]|nr:thiolase family protein [Clostridiaceae bacterium]
MDRVYVLGGARSYIGIENSMYRRIPAERLGAAVLQYVLQKYEIKQPDLVIAGNAVGAGGNIARLMALEAGLPKEVPAYTIDVQCGSGLESIAVAAAKLQCGQADLVIAGGFESSSTAPWRAYHKNHPDYQGEDKRYRVAKFMPGNHRQTAMLEGAERTAQTEGISRRDLDPWVLQSHRLAREARESGVLRDILVEVREGSCQDEGIRDRMNQRLLDRLPCVLQDGEVTTAANACLTNDGAAFVVLASERYCRKHKRMPWAEFLDTAVAGTDPQMSPKAAIAVIDRLLERNSLDYRDVSVYECNEAFAVIDELFARAYPERVSGYNLFGGALAYGHPYGASGGIITLHALKAMQKTAISQKKERVYGICSIAAAGGIGTAILLERRSEYGLF